MYVCIFENCVITYQNDICEYFLKRIVIRMNKIAGRMVRIKARKKSVYIGAQVANILVSKVMMAIGHRVSLLRSAHALITESVGTFIFFRKKKSTFHLEHSLQKLLNNETVHLFKNSKIPLQLMECDLILNFECAVNRVNCMNLSECMEFFTRCHHMNKICTWSKNNRAAHCRRIFDSKQNMAAPYKIYSI